MKFFQLKSSLFKFAIFEYYLKPTINCSYLDLVIAYKLPINRIHQYFEYKINKNIVNNSDLKNKNKMDLLEGKIHLTERINNDYEIFLETLKNKSYCFQKEYVMIK